MPEPGVSMILRDVREALARLDAQAEVLHAFRGRAEEVARRAESEGACSAREVRELAREVGLFLHEAARLAGQWFPSRSLPSYIADVRARVAAGEMEHASVACFPLDLPALRRAAEHREAPPGTRQALEALEHAVALALAGKAAVPRRDRERSVAAA